MTTNGRTGMRRSGSADLPLHGGHVPKWLADRMTALGRVLTEAIVHEYGTAEMLRRLSHPFWFQSLGAVMGMDWHSSGITTSVLGALKRGCTPIAGELGLYICGGRGRVSRETPAELARVGEITGGDAMSWIGASRMVAKVDSAAVQDGFDLYLHGFFVDRDGLWTVVQQGMNPADKTARRYHWLGEELTSFVDDPHAAIEGTPHGAPLVNLTDARAAASRDAQLEILADRTPEAILLEVGKIRRAQAAKDPNEQMMLPHLSLPGHHEVTARDVVLRRLHASIAAAKEAGPRDFADLLRTPGVGARTVLSLAMVAEVVHGAPCRFTDPARFSLAHGGKDGHPYPVPLKVYDRTIRVMKEAVYRAKIGQPDKLAAIRKLDDEARRVDRASRTKGQEPSFDGFVAEERRRSHEYGGRTVFGEAKAPEAGADAISDRSRRRSSAVET